MKIIPLGSLLLLLSATMQAQAQQQDGSFFIRACGAAVRYSDGETIGADETMGALFCSSYVSGFLDGVSLTVVASNAQQPICLPENGVANDQAVRVFVKFLWQNPEALNEPGRLLLMISMQKAFPCK